MAKKPGKTKSLGERIRDMRKKLNLELSHVAEKTGHSPEYLHEIEEGKVSPPVGTLIQISRALALDSSSLLAEDKREERRKGYYQRTKSYSYKCLTPDAADKHLWAYQVTLEPRKQHEMVAFKHEGEEFVYVMEGRVEVVVGDDVSVVKKGGSLHFNSGVSHKLKNLSTKASKLLVVVFAP